MSLRELARKYLDEQRNGSCPVSGHLGVSGPDKRQKAVVVQLDNLVRTPGQTRTRISEPACPDNSDKPDNSDRPDSPDNSDKIWRWWEQPVEGWKEGNLTITNMLSGKVTEIDLRSRK